MRSRPGSREGCFGRFLKHLDALLPSVALERMTIGRLMPAPVAAAAAVPKSAAESPGTSAAGWRPRPFGRRRVAHNLRPILMSFSFRLVSDQSLIGSGVANVRRKLPRL